MQRSRNNRRTRKNGFTLIELLVVIAIIAILAAILFPVFARARENARRASCQSNLKQIALGVFQYTQDYDEKFPIYNTGIAYNVANPQPYAWPDIIQPYLKSTQLYQCPSESTPPGSNPTVSGYTKYAINLYLVYGLIDADGTGVGSSGAKSLSVLTQPSLTVMMLDYQASTGTSAHSVGCSGTTRPCTAGLAQYPTGIALRHLDGMNYSFADGHVKWYKSQNATTSASVYNSYTPSTTSGNSPTFKLDP